MNKSNPVRLLFFILQIRENLFYKLYKKKITKVLFFEYKVLNLSYQ